jgi:type IV pilus assembly protein PilY1
MNPIKRFAHPATSFCVAIVLAIASGSAAATIPSPMNLPRAPLFLTASVDPNVALTLDDSGSMAWPYLPDGLEGSCGYRHPRFFSHVGNRLYYNPAVNYTPPLAADGTPFPNASFAAAWLDGYEGPGSPKTGKVATPTINLETSYFPKRGTQNANSTTAQFVGHDPRLRPIAPDLNLVSNLGTADVWYFNSCTNPTNASTPTPVPPVSGGGSQPIDTTHAWLPFTSANNQTTGTFFRGTTGGTSAAFYYRFTGDPTVPAQVNNPRLYEAVNVANGTAAERQNFANWFSYYSNRYLLARTAMTRSFGVQDAGLRVAYQQINALGFNPGTSTLNKFDGVARTNFFQRIYSLPTSGGTPNRNALNRAGRLFAYGTPAITNNTNPYWEGAPVSRELTCRQNFHIHVTDGYSNGPNPSPTPAFGWATLTAGRTLPDAKVYAPAASVSRIFGNIRTPTNFGGCYDATSCVMSKASLAWTYWANDLRPDLDNNVPPFFGNRTTGVTAPAIVGPLGNPADVPEIYWNPDNDPAVWQHMVNFTVGLGVGGVRAWPGDYDALRAGTLAWPGFRSNQQETVDDLWHAGLVSRGGFFSAANPQELVDSISAALSSVVARRGTAASATVTSGIIQASTLAFRTGFDSGDWSGQVFAYKVNPDGSLVTPPVWQAGDELNSRTAADRVIITSASADGDGIPFQWGSLPGDYQAALNDDPATSIIDDDTLGERRLEYIRGDRSFEVNNGGSFRIRSGLLGAVVNSGAAVVAAPAAAYTNRSFPGGPEASAAQKYAQFRAANRNRDRVIYVGANDGMLHAFDAGSGITGFDAFGNPLVDLGTGRELWAYVPREVAPNLSRMTNSTFEFTPYVDNSPVVRDVFIGGRWRTILVGSLRRGGQGIFALDVTNPNVSEADADDVVLWEFSDDIAGKERMGFSYGRPNISRLANGKWVVIVSGGYNSEQSTMSEPQVAPPDPALPSGGSTLFVLDAQTGVEIRRFEFDPAVSRGLSSPTMGDYETDFIDEFAVAGDLQGNLWRFDLSDPNPANWAVDRMYRPAGIDEFKRPITSAPRLFPDAKTGGLIAVFSTGKYLESGDRSVTGVPTQMLMGVRDYGRASANYPITVGQLQVQTLTKTVAIPPAASTFAVTNNNVVDTQRGWRINLVDLGERGVTSAGALFSQGIAIFSTVIPNGDDPCRPGLSGNLYVLDSSTGGAPRFDRNGDGVVTAADLGEKIGQSVLEAPAEGSPSLLVPPGGGMGFLVDFPDIQVPTTVWRRRTWREIRPED